MRRESNSLLAGESNLTCRLKVADVDRVEIDDMYVRESTQR